MSVSLAKIDEKIGAKRRALAELVEKRENAFDATDSVSAKIDAGLTGADLENALVSLKASKKEAIELADQIRAIESEVRDLESERASREEHNRQVAALGNRQERKTDAGVVEFDANSRVSVQDLTAAQADHDISSFLRNTYIAKQAGMSLASVCAGQAGDKYRNDRLLAVTDKTAGATLLPSNYLPRVIELLRPYTVVRRMAGVRNVPLVNGNLTLPRQSAGSTANYAGESTNIPVSDIGSDSIQFTEKKLTVMVVSSGELVRQASPAADALIRDDIIRQLAVKEDQTFLRAAGSSTIPKGIKAFADAVSASQVIAANATINLANVTADLSKLQLALANADTPMLSCYWVLAPRVANYLKWLRDGNGNLAFPEMQTGSLMGYPYMVTTSIPTNLGVGTNESEVYFVDSSELIIAESPLFDVAVSTEAAYHDGTNVQAAFSKDQVVFRLITGHDFNIRHTKSAAYLSTVKWA